MTGLRWCDVLKVVVVEAVKAVDRGYVESFHINQNSVLDDL